MKRQALLLLTLLLSILTLCLALGFSGCSSSSSTETTATPAISAAEDTADALEGAWYRCAAVKADGTAYTDEELAGNYGDIVFEDGAFTEDWPEATYHGSYTYADRVVTLTYDSDAEVQTLTLKDDGFLTYTYENADSEWDGETSTYTRVSPIDGTWLLTSGTNADGTAFTAERLADSSLVFGKGVFSENWPGGETHPGTFVYTAKDRSIVLTYDEGGGGQTLTLDDGDSTIAWRYVNEDANDANYQYNGEVYHYTLKAAD